MERISLAELPALGVSHNGRIRKRVWIAPGRLDPVVQYARAVFPPGESAPAHAHADMAEVFTAESGSGEIRIDGKPHAFAAGTTIIVEPGETHEIANTGASELVVTYFGVRVR